VIELRLERVEVELGAVLGRMGRTDDAIVHLDRAEALLPDHPATSFTRGEVYAQVWRWAEAERAYTKAARLAPRDDRAWRALAIARGSMGDRQGALESAQMGLELNPRDPHLLRSQSIALAALDPGSARAIEAKRLWLRYRRDDEAPAFKAKCRDEAPDCQRERVPIFARPLRDASASPTKGR
jgi:tetratricopeptide (TPR) repeat protein